MSITICAFGASTTYGAWDRQLGGWVNRLRLAMDSTSSNIHVFNLGVSGATSADVLRRFDVESEAREPDLVIFQLGNNDLLDRGVTGQPAVPPKDFVANLEQLVEKARRFTQHIVFLGITRYDERKTLPVSWGQFYYRNSAGEQYDHAIQAAATRLGAGYVPLRDVLSDDDLTDGLHPNEAGHQKIFEVVRGFLLKQGWIT